MTTCILVVNNLRDLETDRSAGKRTLVVMFGARSAQAEFVALLILAYSVPIGLWLARVASLWVVLPLATIPFAAQLLAEIKVPAAGPALNHTLAGTARLSLLFSVLFSIGLIL